MKHPRSENIALKPKNNDVFDVVQVKSSIMQSLIEKLITKFIRKKLGVDNGLCINKLLVKTEPAHNKAYFNIEITGYANLEDIVKILSDSLLKE